MNKYANPADELRIRETITAAVCSGKSVVCDAQNQLPPAFAPFAIHEVAICASDMIVDGLLLKVEENDLGVWVINASNSYNPTKVVPAKGLHSMYKDLTTPQPGFWNRNRDTIYVNAVTHAISALLGGVIGWLLK